MLKRCERGLTDSERACGCVLADLVTGRSNTGRGHLRLHGLRPSDTSLAAAGHFARFAVSLHDV